MIVDRKTAFSSTSVRPGALREGSDGNTAHTHTNAPTRAPTLIRLKGMVATAAPNAVDLGKAALYSAKA